MGAHPSPPCLLLLYHGITRGVATTCIIARCLRSIWQTQHLASPVCLIAMPCTRTHTHTESMQLSLNLLRRRERSMSHARGYLCSYPRPLYMYRPPATSIKVWYCQIHADNEVMIAKQRNAYRLSRSTLLNVCVCTKDY